MNTKTRILEAVITESQNFAISKISTLRVSKKAQTSESNIFKIFKTKNNLLIETFIYTDEKIGRYIEKNVQPIEANSIENVIFFSKEVWFAYLEFFVKHYAYAVYYSLFRMSKHYVGDVSEKQKNNYLFLLPMFEYISRDSNIYSMISFDLLWSFILDTTLLIAKRMGTKEIAYTKENIENSYHLVFDGLINVFMKNSKK